MKANSERVTGKNFRMLGSKPLFKHILDTLLSVDEIDEVIINTDARSILKENGLVDGGRVTIRDRPNELCGDFVSMNSILENDMNQVDADVYIMTHTTNPLIRAESIKKGLELISSNASCDSVFSVNRVQTRFYRDDGSAVNHDPNNLIRTQDLEPWFEENSCLYYFTKQSFGQTNARIGRRPEMMETPQLESLDIDEPADWDMVEALVLSGKLN
jgi:CMP-N-acetylneuraminic acid synthetase